MGKKKSWADLGLKRWDVVDYLKTEEDYRLYFEAMSEGDDPHWKKIALEDIARAKKRMRAQKASREFDGKG